MTPPQEEQRSWGGGHLLWGSPSEAGQLALGAGSASGGAGQLYTQALTRALGPDMEQKLQESQA